MCDECGCGDAKIPTVKIDLGERSERPPKKTPTTDEAGGEARVLLADGDAVLKKRKRKPEER